MSQNPWNVQELAFKKALDLLSQLNHHGVQYKVFGAMAMIAHGLVRVTEDVDLFVKPTPDNIDRLKRALRAVWDDPAIDEITSEDLCGDYPAVAYGPPDDSIGLDILTRLGEMYDYESVETEIKQVGEIRFPAATPRMLYRMKRDTVRPKDRADAELIREVFRLEDDP